MAILEVIKYEGPHDVFIWKHKCEDFNTKSQLIVSESQEAILFKNGQALDTFGPGRHTLDTQNIPLLRKLINLPFGGQSPFHCQVYFINKVHSLDIRWGTRTRMPIQDPVYNVILPIGASGQFGVSIEDGRKLLVKLVGTENSFSQEELSTYFRGVLMTHIKDSIAKKMTQDGLTFLNIHANLLDISAAVEKDMQSIFGDYGVKLVNFYITTIIVPEDDPAYVRLRDSLSKKAEMGVLGYDYQTERQYDILQAAAKNEGNPSSLMGAGVGMGLGVNMGNFFGQTMEQNFGTFNAQPQSVCVKCGRSIQKDARFCSYCGAEQIRPQENVARTIKCPGCGRDVPEGKFCLYCGRTLIVYCPNCGKETSGKFCSNCGTKIGE